MKTPIFEKGFTLLEIMIALAVFAILASITSSALYRSFDTRTRVNKQADRLNTVQLVISRIERDTQQLTERAVRGNEMHLFAPLIGQPQYMEFTHRGLVNPNYEMQSSTMKRVAYLCRKNQLIRRSWENLDLPDRAHFQDQLLLDNLDECTFSYLAHNHEVLTEWRENAVQQNQKREPLPIAIQLNITLHDWGNMNLLFIIPESLYAS